MAMTTRALLKRLEEHKAALLDPQLYIYKDKKRGDLVDTDAWYSDRLHDALHAILDGIPEMEAGSHAGQKGFSWMQRKDGMDGAEAMKIYEKIVQAVEARKGALGLVGGAEHAKPGGYVERVYAEKHGAAALEIVSDRAPRHASVSVIHYTPDDSNVYDLVRKAGAKRTLRPVPAKDFDFTA
jgi:hypothetical protein